MFGCFMFKMPGDEVMNRFGVGRTDQLTKECKIMAREFSGCLEMASFYALTVHLCVC